MGREFFLINARQIVRFPFLRLLFGKSRATFKENRFEIMHFRINICGCEQIPEHFVNHEYN